MLDNVEPLQLFPATDVCFFLLAVRLRLSGSERPESKHAGRAHHRPHRLLRGPHDGRVCVWGDFR